MAQTRQIHGYPDKEQGMGVATPVHPNVHDTGPSGYGSQELPGSNALARNFLSLHLLMWLFVGLIALILITAVIQTRPTAPERAIHPTAPIAPETPTPPAVPNRLVPH